MTPAAQKLQQAQAKIEEAFDLIFATLRDEGIAPNEDYHAVRALLIIDAMCHGMSSGLTQTLLIIRLGSILYKRSCQSAKDYFNAYMAARRGDHTAMTDTAKEMVEEAERLHQWTLAKGKDFGRS